MLDQATPNHHATAPGFSGLTGALAAVTFLIGREADSRLACDLTAVEPGNHVVDIGCGPGKAVRTAIARGASATGIDPAPVMLRTARAATRGPGAAWLEGTAEAIPLSDACADVIWSIATVHHWNHVEVGLAECRRVLLPGGRLLAMERRREAGSTGHASHGWTDAQADRFAQMCTEAGFVDPVVSQHQTRRGTVLAVLAHRPDDRSRP